MPAYRDEQHGTFYASFYYTDFTGARRKKMKRGFKLKRDALEWERQFLLQRNADPDMKFGDFVEIYRGDKRERIREHTWESKDNMINTKILPYFKDRTLSEIEPRDVIAWQNTLMSIRQKNGKGQDVITEPKTSKSNRIIRIPRFLAEEMQNYLKSLYGLRPTDRIFPITKSYLHREMSRGSKAAGVKRIRIHDLRHSHVSLLIEMGFSAVAIAERVGHESIDITYRYAHLFPDKQTEMANRLDDKWTKRGEDACPEK